MKRINAILRYSAVKKIIIHVVKYAIRTKSDMIKLRIYNKCPFLQKKTQKIKKPPTDVQYTTQI